MEFAARNMTKPNVNHFWLKPVFKKNDPFDTGGSMAKR
jgi:hypothetical protein